MKITDIKDPETIEKKEDQLLNEQASDVAEWKENDDLSLLIGKQHPKYDERMTYLGSLRKHNPGLYQRMKTME